MPGRRTELESPLAASLRAQVENVLATLDSADATEGVRPGKAALRRFLDALDELGAAAAAVQRGEASAAPSGKTRVALVSPPAGAAGELRSTLPVSWEIAAGEDPDADVAIVWEPGAAAAVARMRERRAELPAIVIAPQPVVAELVRTFGERPAILLQEPVATEAVAFAVRTLLSPRNPAPAPAGPSLDPRSYSHLLGMLPRALERAIDFDVGAGILVRPGQEALVDVHATSAVSSEVLDEVRLATLELFHLVAGGPLRGGAAALRTPSSIRSSLHAPLATGGRVVGLTYLGSFRENAFTAEDERTLSALAENASGAYGRLDGTVRRLRLTPRQSQILSLIAAGLSDREVGERLGLAHRTVRTHLDRLLREHGLHTRTEAVTAWLRGQQG